LAVFYGENVLSWIKENGALVLAIVATVCVGGLIIYLIKNRRKPAAEKAVEDPATTPDA
jgi:uncharacterized membrane protein